MNSLLKKIFLAAIPLCVSTSVVQAANFQTLNVKQQTSHYMDMGKQVKSIAVGDPSIATVVQVPGSAHEFLVVAKAVSGSTTMFVWTADGARYEYLIVVSPEDTIRADMIERAINLPDVHVKYVEGRLLLTGTVKNQYEKNYALQTARLFVNAGTESSLLVGSGFDMKLQTTAATNTGRSGNIEVNRSENRGEIIDLLQILRPTQIRLEAQIIEVNSDAAKELGLRYGQDPTNSPGVFAFGEGYSRSHTSISESSSNGWSNSYSGSGSNSYSDSYTTSSSGSSSSSSDDGSSTSTSTYDSSTSNSNSRGGSRNRDGSSSFSRTVTSTWDDLRRFGNNPLKWVTQHFAPINVAISALVENGKAKILSRPSVMTLSGEQATIQIGGEIPYTSYNDNGRPSVEFKNYGIILQFKPVVDAQNRINSAIHAEVSNMSGQYVDSQPIISTRSADSVISLPSGSPIVIGGLMDSSESKRVQKIPLLGDIPILGEFFKHTSRSRDKREIIIVVTPYLVGEDDISQSPMSQQMQDWYDQQEQLRKEMQSHDFKNPEPEVVIEEETERILPSPNYSKTTDAPFK